MRDSLVTHSTTNGCSETILFLFNHILRFVVCSLSFSQHGRRSCAACVRYATAVTNRIERFHDGFQPFAGITILGV